MRSTAGAKRCSGSETVRTSFGQRLRASSRAGPRPAVRQQSGVHPARQRAEVVQGRRQLLHAPRQAGVLRAPLQGPPQVEAEGEQLLLRPVVEVAFEPTPGLVGCLDDAGPGGLELAHLGLEARGEAGVLDGEPQLGGERGGQRVGPPGVGRVVHPGDQVRAQRGPGSSPARWPARPTAARRRRPTPRARPRSRG